MFYSQFILAKKGPLGTIWIAAHLERKLRKNQVADTDIGISVDSIIRPEVPIALRLSSHLLVGVVRIYSKKVNYLFHDCSEALLKIKQAFRSAAVDLPPEESTAPYHSITLPETFDLDDFELPDVVLQGNVVDHHVSTREQITLQDKVENTAYTIMQFGLDERFGDGDTSQIRLDLDEELFTKKDHSILSENLENQLSGPPETPFTPYVNMDIDDFQDDLEENRAEEDSANIPTSTDRNFGQPNQSHETITANSSNLQGYNIQTPDLNQTIFPEEGTRDLESVQNCTDKSCPLKGGPSIDLLGPTQAPPTPVLLEEAHAVHIQDAISSHQGKNSLSNGQDDIIPDRMQVESGCCDLKILMGDPSLPHTDVPLKGAVGLPTEDCENSCRVIANEVSRDNDSNITGGEAHVLDHRLTVDAYNIKNLSEKNIQDAESALPTSGLSIPDNRFTSTGRSEMVESALPTSDVSILDSRFTSTGRIEMNQGVESALPTSGLSPLDDRLASTWRTDMNKDVENPLPTSGFSILDDRFASTWRTEKNQGAISALLTSGMSIPDDRLTSPGRTELNKGAMSTPPPSGFSILNDRSGRTEMNQGGENALPASGLSILDDRYTSAGRTETNQYVRSAMPTSGLSMLDDRLASTERREMNHSFPVDKPDVAYASQSKSAVAMDPFYNHTVVTPDLGYPQQPCASKDQINGSHSENQTFGDNNRHNLVENIFGKKMPKGGSSLEGQGGGVWSSSFMDNGSQMIQMTGNASCVNYCSSGSGYPEPERVMLAPMNMYSLQNSTQYYISQEGMLGLDGSAQMHSTMSAMGHYPESERIMLASTSNHGFSNVLEQSVVGKNLRETDGSRAYHGLSGNELMFGEGSPALLTSNSMKLPELSRSKQKPDYIPDDDDLLASILGKKRMPASKAKHSPPIQLMPSSKRHKLTPKAGALKRKVLIDDTMVLNADMIRQQLMNTDDIRRMRKKAPCTHLEMWMIQKFSLQEEIFSESIITDMCPELASIQHLMHGQNGSVQHRLGTCHSPFVMSKLNIPKESPVTSRDLAGLNNLTVTGPQDPHERNNILLVSGAKDTAVDVQDTPPQTFSVNDVTCSVPSREAGNSDGGSKVVDSASVGAGPCSINGPPGTDNEREASTMTMSQETILNISCEHREQTMHPNVQKDVPVPPEIACSGDDPHISESRSITNGKIDDAEASPGLVSEERLYIQGSCEDTPLLDTGRVDKVLAETAYNSDGGPNGSENRSAIIDEMQPASANENDVLIREQHADTAVDNNDESPCEKSQYIATSDVITSVMEDALESNIENEKQIEEVEDAGALRDSCELSAVDENDHDHDTDFLDIDDEVDFDEEVDYDLPNSDESQSLENSGWSTRTRGVARYLKLLFDDETGYGRKDVQLDRLLSGKTQKEASRMFFETLVLKTRDYIHVEQENAFGSIRIEPRSTLLKTTF